MLGPATEGRLHLALYALEAGAVGLLLALYKYADRISALTLRQTVLLCGFVVVLLAALAYVVKSHHDFKRAGGRTFQLTLIMKIVTVAMLFGVGEAVVWVASVDTPLGRTFAGTRLAPRSWATTKSRAAKLMLDAPPPTAYFISDTLLGWTVGPSRGSKDGMYLSSAEGIRSPRAGVSFRADSAAKHVTIVGDSYTFSEDGPFEDSWGLKLENLLGGEAKVLNFGVPGYAVDQAYLRYSRDARPWHPNVAIFGFINHDLSRSMSVYWLISSPEWGFPMAKPRFGLKNDDIELLNVPLISPDSLLATQSVSDLPFVMYDPGYDPAEWRPHFYHSSYLVRFLLGRFPRYSLPRPEVSEQALVRINSRLLLNFTRMAAGEGTIPLMTYYPSRSDFEGTDLSVRDSVAAALKRAGVEYIDLTACVRAIGPDKAFIRGKRHYSAAGNQAVAQCLLPVVKRSLAGGLAQRGSR